MIFKDIFSILLGKNVPRNTSELGSPLPVSNLSSWCIPLIEVSLIERLDSKSNQTGRKM